MPGKGGRGKIGASKETNIYWQKAKNMKYQEQITEWVNMYLKHIREISIEKHVTEEEGYKFQSVQHFQSHFDIEAADIAGNLESSILNNNLVVGAQFFPLKMLIIFAQTFPEDTRNILRALFDESGDIVARINEAKKAFEVLNEKRNKQMTKPSANTYIGLRFLSLLLGYRFPEKYNALKPAEWKVFVRFLDPDFFIPQRTPPGEQYKIYSEYIESLREYLKARTDIAEIKNKLVESLAFRDEEYRWITQDVIFVTSRVLANARAGEVVAPEYKKRGKEAENIISKTDEDELSDNGTGFMPLEEYLEEYVVKNWSNINFGENLALYHDEDGNPGQQYTTDVGIIDILAKDKNDDFVVIELKRAESGYKVVGQVLNYMGWVQANLAQKNQKVRGMIIVGKADKTLQHALMPVSDKIALKEYRISMKLIESE